MEVEKKLNNFNLNSELILKLTSFCYLIIKFISFNLWFSFYRTIPEIRNFELINNSISIYFTNILSASSICILIYLTLKSNKRLIILLLILEFILAAFDHFRWQAYVFQFFLTYFFYVFYRERFFTLLLILLSGTYIYSGLNKLNSGFIHQIWYEFILNDFFKLPETFCTNSTVLRFGYLIGITEFLLGFLILFYRKAFLGIALLHLFVLVLIGPFGLKMNEVVWPWNLLMLILALIYYFYINYNIEINFNPNFKLLIVFVIVFILPIFNFFSLYNPYFSFELYSGKTKIVYLITKDKRFEKFKIKNPQIYRIPCEKNEIAFNINQLNYKSLKVPIPPYLPSIELYKEKLKKIYKLKNSRFLITDYPYSKFESL